MPKMKTFADEIQYLFVDFNEGVSPGKLYLLSKTDIKLDIDGVPCTIIGGMKIYVWDGDIDDYGNEGILVANGVAELNTIELGSWSSDKVKWCCRINKNSFRHEIRDCSKFFEESEKLREKHKGE